MLINRNKIIAIKILMMGVLLLMAACSNDNEKHHAEKTNKIDVSQVKAYSSDGEETEILSKEDLKEELKLDTRLLSEEIESPLTSYVEKTNDGSFIFVVTNPSNEQQTIIFSSSQRYDFNILNENGTTVYTFSEGKSFLDVMEEMTLDPGEEVTFELEIPDLDPGNYSLSVRLTSNILAVGNLQFTVE